LALRPILFLSLLCAVQATAVCAEPVGEAATVKNDVTGKLGVQIRPISVGDSLSGNETVKTGNESATQVHFLDDTRLSIGPTSAVVLDRFVVNTNKSTKDAVINMTTGTLRFVTGASDPKNFTIKTKVLTLGIRGTDFTVKCERLGPSDKQLKCAVMVLSGHVRICPTDTSGNPGIRFALRNVACRGGYDLDPTHNFTTVGADGENSGPQSVPVSVIEALNVSEFTNAQQITLASILPDAQTGGINNGGGENFTAPANFAAIPGQAPAGGGGGGATVINNANLLTPQCGNRPLVFQCGTLASLSNTPTCYNAQNVPFCSISP
jgi:hypothetical protein